MTSFQRPWLRWIAALLPAALALPSCATTSTTGTNHHNPRPGWACTISQIAKDRIEIVEVNVTVDEDGRQLDGSLSWRLRSGVHGFAVHASVTGDAPLRPNDGTFSVTWDRPPPPGIQLPRLRLELTSDPDQRHWHHSPFAGQYHFVGGGYGLTTSWADTLAFVSGANTLTLLLRDPNGGIVDRRSVPREVLVGGASTVAAVLERMRLVAADFRQQCLHIEDLDEPIIIR